MTGLDIYGASRRRNGSSSPHRRFSDTTAIGGLPADLSVGSGELVLWGDCESDEGTGSLHAELRRSLGPAAEQPSI